MKNGGALDIVQVCVFLSAYPSVIPRMTISRLQCLFFTIYIKTLGSTGWKCDPLTFIFSYKIVTGLVIILVRIVNIIDCQYVE